MPKYTKTEITFLNAYDEVSIVDGCLTTDINGSEEFDIVRTPKKYAMTDVEHIARATHEANRVYCQLLGDTSQDSWEDAPQWQRDSALDGVQSILSGKTTTPEEQHIAWMRHKEQDGWTWGPVKDIEAKTHPCMLNYDQLPIEQRVKDIIFRAIVIAEMAATKRMLKCNICNNIICVQCAGSDPEICMDCEYDSDSQAE